MKLILALLGIIAVMAVPSAFASQDYQHLLDIGCIEEQFEMEGADVVPADDAYSTTVSSSTVTKGDSITFEATPDTAWDYHLEYGSWQYFCILDPNGVVVHSEEVFIQDEEWGTFTTTLDVPYQADSGDHELIYLSFGVQSERSEEYFMLNHPTRIVTVQDGPIVPDKWVYDQGDMMNFTVSVPQASNGNLGGVDFFSPANNGLAFIAHSLIEDGKFSVLVDTSKYTNSAWNPGEYTVRGLWYDDTFEQTVIGPITITIE